MSVGDGAKDVKKKDLEPKEKYDGIRVYPVRYGIHRLKTDKNQLINDNLNKCKLSHGRSTERTISGHPKIEPHKYYPMPLRKGWLYVYSEIAQGLYEFSCDDTSLSLLKKTNFYTQTKKELDRREIIDASMGYLSVSEKDDIFLFYSEVKLTHECVVDVFLKKKQRDIMHELNCKTWCAGYTPSPTSREISVEDISISYPQEGTVNYDDAFIKIYDRMLNQAKRNNKDKTEKKDVFFIVDDPIGVASQIQFYLQEKHLDHEAFVRSIRTGESFAKIKDSISKYEKNESIIPDSDILPGYSKLEHYASIHNLGILIYQLLYVNYDPNAKNAKYLNKARRSTDKDLVENILAVDLRSDLRRQIEQYRKDLKTYIEGVSYQNYCGFFCQLNPPSDKTKEAAYYKMLLEAKTVVIGSYHTLSVLPHTKDQYIDGEDKTYKDPCKTCFTACFDEKNS